MQNRYLNGATPTYTIQLYWSDGTKTWHLRMVDRAGRPIGGLRTESQVDLDRPAALSLLRSVRRELEMLLPF